MTCFSCGHQARDHDEEGYCRFTNEDRGDVLVECGCSCYVAEELTKGGS